MKMPKPFFRTQTKSWYVQINGKQHNLGADKEIAMQEYGRLIAGRQPVTDRTTVVTLLFQFLTWCKEHRAASTHEQYAFYIHRFAKFIGDSLLIEKLTPDHVTTWIDKEFAEHDENTKRNAIRNVQRAFNWAVKNRKLKASPITGVEKPAYTPRDKIIEPEQWRQLVALLNAGSDSGRCFLDILTVMRQTGCRPIEARTVEAKDLDRQNHCFVFERGKSKGHGKGKKQKAERRIVPLTAEVFGLCEKQALKYPTGPLFRNVKGTPWTSHAIHRRCKRLNDQLSFSINVYAIRHTWATEAMERGVDVITIAKIMGHKNLNMLLEVYSHVEKKKPYLRQAMEQAIGLTPTPEATLPMKHSA